MMHRTRSDPKLDWQLVRTLCNSIPKRLQIVKLLRFGELAEPWRFWNRCVSHGRMQACERRMELNSAAVRQSGHNYPLRSFIRHHVQNWYT